MIWRATLCVALLVGLIPVVVPLSSLAATILTAPSLLLIPTGVGMVLLFRRPFRLWPQLTVIQNLLLAYFVGLFVSIVIFVASERYLGSNGRPDILLGFLWIIALVGWLQFRKLEWPQTSQRILLVIAVAVFLTAFRYIYSITIYSEYPVTDLFQRVHFHAGAWAFARDMTLNPFVASSYIPFQQLQLGLLLRLTGADPLVAEWVWPAAMAPLQAAAVYAFASRYASDQKATTLAFLLILAQLGLSNPTNGAIAELAVITILSCLLPQGEFNESKSRSAAERFLGLVAGIVLGVIMTKISLAFAILILAFVIMLVQPLNKQFAQNPLPWAILIFSAVTIPFHRGALLYLVMGGGAAFSYGYMANVFREDYIKFSHCAYALLGVIAASLGVMLATIVHSDRSAQDIFGLWTLFDLVLMPLVGKSLSVVAIDGDLAPGAGSRVALFELARAVSPIVVGSLALSLLLSLSPPLRRRFGHSNNAIFRLIICQVIVAAAICAAILTGFPFIHRASFLVVIFASVALANVIASATSESYRDWPILFSSYLFVVAGGIYLFASPDATPYLSRLLPAVLTLLAAVLAMSFFVLIGRHRYWTGSLLIILVVAAETALSRTYFKPYAFHRQPVPEIGALSSFDRQDLLLGSQIAGLANGDEMLVSDPKTMSFLQARTGLHPLISISNLDTIDGGLRQVLVSRLTNLIGTDKTDVCAGLAEFVDGGASANFNYSNVRNSNGQNNGKSALEALGYYNRLTPAFGHKTKPTHGTFAVTLDEVERSFLVVVHPATVKWLRLPPRLSYFPVKEQLDGEFIQHLKAKFPDGHLVQNAFVIRLRCKQ